MSAVIAETTRDRIRRVFSPIIDQIAEGAVDRERARRLPVDEVRLLRDAGFGALRVPAEHGGWDVTLPELFELLIRIGEADSNLPQLLRGHMAFVELQRAAPASPQRTAWLQDIGRGGVLFGNAQAERGPSSTVETTLVESSDGLRVEGRKFYSTGTLFADWIWSGGRRGDEFVAFAVKADQPGVERVDDWGGFGQRLTGSGTTVFSGAKVDPAHVMPWSELDAQRSLSFTQAFYQLVLLAALTGVSGAVVRDAVAFVRPRTRTFGVPGTSSPKDDPLVQSVVGRLSSLRFAAEATTLAAVARLAEADGLRTGSAAEDDPRYDDALASVFEAQQLVIDLVLEATTDAFEVGGASAVDADRGLDRHWRNARTLASHNPAIQRAALIGRYRLTGEAPHSPQAARRAGSAPGPG